MSVKVLYVIGWGRSGSTILDNVLGQLDGCFSTGELHYFWERQRPAGVLVRVRRARPQL